MPSPFTDPATRRDARHLTPHPASYFLLPQTLARSLPEPLPMEWNRALLGSLVLVVGCTSAPGGTSGPDAAAPIDAAWPRADGSTPSADASSPTTDGGTPDCVPDNSPEALAARDGFLEVCVDRARFPEAVCGDGSTFRFSYRPAEVSSEGLLLYFRGGGFCNDYVSCWGRDGRGGDGRRVGTMTNSENTAPSVIPALGRTIGIFDREDPDSPFARFDVVHVSYCTGDTGGGTERIELVRPPDADPSAPASIPTFFHGAYNVAAAIAWVQETFPRPPRLVVYGSSAGSYASSRALPEVLAAYPETAAVTWIGDGGAGVGRASAGDLDALLVRYDGSTDRLVRFAQFSFQSDATQIEFLPAGSGGEAEFRAGLRAIVESRSTAAPDRYRSFAPPGTCHTIAQSVALYRQFTTAGGRLSPVVPEVRPNPDVTLDGVAVTAWLRSIVYGSGPMGADIESHAGDWTTPRLDCPLGR